MPSTHLTPGHRINVIGASGTGKSTLGKAISDRLQIPIFESDDYLHIASDPPFQRQRPVEERFRLIVRDLSQHRSWVLTGLARSWGHHPALESSLVVFLYLPPAIRESRLRERESRTFGPRIQSGGDMEKTHRAFMDWSAAYDLDASQGTNLVSHRAYLKGIECPVLEFNVPMSTEDMMAAVLATLRI